MIEIKEVKTLKERKEFLNFPLKLYKDNPYFVPPLYADEKKIFHKNYVYYDTCEAIYFNAYQDGKMVGRISGILQKAANEKYHENRIRFTRFDCIDNQEVANKLFEALESWAKSKKMDTICGPLGFSDLEREGLLIEGFNELSTFEEQYNFPYYQKLIENCGYQKEVDWVERKLYLPKVKNERFFELCDLLLKRYKLHYGTAKNTREFLKKYANKFFEILDKTYENIYGTVPFTKGMKKMLISNFKLIINMKYVNVLLDENDRVVCFGLCFPSLAKAIQPSQGHLTIPAIFRVLNAIKHPKIIDLGLIGVLPEYAKKGISSSFVAQILKMLENNKDLEYAETNLNLEDNFAIINAWKSFDAKLHKRRRAFIKKI